MTPEERAWSIAEEIREAVAAEREACAQLAESKRVSLRGTDTFVSNRALIADEIAAAIRARTNV